jgi:putative FmdB family regulatory protein
MPIYQYRCKKCGYEFEDTKKISERYEGQCPDCDSEELEIIPSPVNIKVN